jgi:succinyl-diaminopimelate desuccinylase
MKSGLAIMLKLAKEINNDNLAFVFSVDEEYEFKGALKLKEIKNFNPEFIINIEPTDNKILNGCRGITEFSFVVHGKSVHAGRKKFGINAIEKSVELVKIFQKELTKMDTIDGGKTTINLAYLHGGTLKMSNSQNVELSELGMVVPNYSKVNCEIRVANPKITQKFIQNKLQEIAQKLKITIDNFNFKFYFGSMLTPKSELKEFEKAIIQSKSKIKYADISLSGYYEVQILQENWQSKSVIFGPGPIGLSHSVDEYANINSIKKSEKIIRKYIDTIINQ